MAKVLSTGFRCLTALKLLASAEEDLPLQQVAARLKLHPSTAHRVLATLISHGLVEQAPDRRYRLGLGSFAVGAAFLRRSSIRRAAIPVLMDLGEHTQASTYLAFWHRNQVVIVESYPCPGMYYLLSEVGSIVPAYAAAIGKALLAYQGKYALKSIGPLRPYTPNTITSIPTLRKEIERVRKRGYAVDNEEVVRGCRCVASPIPNGSKEPLAAISISAPPNIIHPQSIPKLAAMVRSAALKISTQLGYQPLGHPPRAHLQ